MHDGLCLLKKVVQIQTSTIRLRLQGYILLCLIPIPTIEKVHLLQFAEEICYNGALIIKPISSGLGIGASNWVVTGPRRSLTYIAGFIIDSGHSKGLDIPLLHGADLILFFSFFVFD